MRKLKKYKIRKIIIVVTSLLVILFGILIFAEGKNNNLKKGQSEEKQGEQQKQEEQEEQEGVADNIEKNPESEQEKPEEPVNGIGNEEPQQPSDETDESITVENPEAIDVLINKSNNLPSTYVPKDLVTLSDVPTVLSNSEINQLRSVAYEALKELFNAAKDEEGYVLYARSGYRSYNTQSSLYSSYVETYGQKAADKYSAKPGQSEHQTGLSLDITCEGVNYQLSENFADTPEGKWVSENAHRFGFIIRYPKGKEDITQYNYEPWHIRYLGTDLAEKVYESGLTWEEYQGAGTHP